MKTDPTFKINDLAKELGVSIQTIKNYEASGILPNAKRDAKGWRFYTEEDILKIKALFQEEITSLPGGRQAKSEKRKATGHSWLLR